MSDLAARLRIRRQSLSVATPERALLLPSLAAMMQRALRFSTLPPACPGFSAGCVQVQIQPFTIGYSYEYIYSMQWAPTESA